MRPEDGAADFPDLLDPAGPTVPETARKLLEQTGAELRGLADNSADERPEAMRRLRGTLAALSHEAGRPAQILIEEDAVLEDVRVSTADWRGQLDDLAAGVALLSVFDWMHDIRALLSAVFVERFGVGAEVSLSDHADYLSAETYRRAYRLPEKAPPANWARPTARWTGCTRCGRTSSTPRSPPSTRRWPPTRPSAGVPPRHST